MSQVYSTCAALDFHSARALDFLRTWAPKQKGKRYNFSKAVREMLLEDARALGFQAEEQETCAKCHGGFVLFHSAADTSALDDLLKCSGCGALETRNVWAKLRQDRKERGDET